MKSPVSKFPLKWYQNRDFSKYIRVWGCKAYIYEKGCKLSANAKAGLFVGVDFLKKGFRVIPEGAQKVAVRRDVTFDESSYPERDRFNHPTLVLLCPSV